jgi:hypothetical protein
MKNKQVFVDLLKFRIKLADLIGIANSDHDVIVMRRGCPVARFSGLTDIERKNFKELSQKSEKYGEL